MEMIIIILISGMKLLLFVVPSIFFVAIRKILKLEEPICLFAGTARKGGSWCPTPQPVLGLEEP